MSIIKQIKNIIEEKHYTYQKIIDFIYKSPQINSKAKNQDRLKNNKLYL